MTIISQKGGNLWQESFDIPRTVIAGGGSLITLHTLQRPGIYLGCALVMDSSETVQVSVRTNAVARQEDNSFLSIGTFITTIETVIQNNDAGTSTTGLHVLVWLRKRGVPA